MRAGGFHDSSATAAMQTMAGDPDALLIEEPRSSQARIQPDVSMAPQQTGIEGGADIGSVDPRRDSRKCIETVLVDLPLSVIFWYWFFFMSFTERQFYTGLAVTAALMCTWRLFLAYGLSRSSAAGPQRSVPYTCGTAVVGGKELVLVATLHISPRSPRDVQAVVASMQPDVVMIELDEERLERMRAPLPSERSSEPSQEDLQPIALISPGSQRDTIHAQRAIWNAEWRGETLRGPVVFDEGNPYGIGPPTVGISGKMVLLERGGCTTHIATYASKSHRLSRAGAQALLCINTDSSPALPRHRIGGVPISSDFRIAFDALSCGFPPLPVLLLSHKDGELVRQAVQEGTAGSVLVEMSVRDDKYPRRTLRRRLCQNFALMFSGIGILYGVIQCFRVEVGGEFLAAEIAANAARIPCVCVDVDLNRFWSRLGSALVPTPCNLFEAFMAWMAFPRIFFSVLFPARASVDVMGSMVLHALALPLRTWVAFVVAGFTASFVTTNVLTLFTRGATEAAVSTGVVEPQQQDDTQIYIMLALELYMLPRIYDAVAASRDEAMYRKIVQKARHHVARRIVVVVGAGHANGILQRVCELGL